MITALPFHLWNGAPTPPRVVHSARIAKLEREADELFGEAENLRDEARELEDKAERLQREIERLKRNDCNAGPEPSTFAAWLLHHLPVDFSWFAQLQLAHVVEHNHRSLLVRVCLEYGIALPAELQPPVPPAAKVNGVSAKWLTDLPLFTGQP